MDQIKDFILATFSIEQALSPIYLACFGMIGALVYLIRRETGGLIAFLLPRAIWTHKSVRADLGLYLFNRVLGVLGVFARFAAVPAVAAWVASLVPRTALDSAALSPLALALIVFVLTDFTNYWTHRLHHDTKALWPLHAVHHSTSVLTPLTAYRQHPLSGIVSIVLTTVIFGVIFGLMVGTFTPDLSIAEIVGANALVVLTNMTVTNFLHSHIWISFGPKLEHVLISPAMHQVHNSIEPRHFNRNYCQALAIWDWMFGTLYVIREKEVVTFGLNDEADAPLMTHRLGPLLIDPVRRILGPSR
ncbi:sterol desaturase family protein [bacterium]|nr:sterol desaturase family protein [bacterium]MDC0012172.1 sterol desaturase family protein [Octadecabacter sp.]